MSIFNPIITGIVKPVVDSIFRSSEEPADINLVQQDGSLILQQNGDEVILNDGVAESRVLSLVFNNSNNAVYLEVIL